MSKLALVIDSPEDCMQCPMFNGADECVMQDDDANFEADTLDELRKGCPLRALPKRILPILGKRLWMEGYARGWNDCIDEITGDEKK